MDDDLLPYLQRLGEEIEYDRKNRARISRAELAALAGLSQWQMWAIESARRRTRRATLRRIANAIAAAATIEQGFRVSAGGLLDRYLYLAGRALAPESERQTSIERGRDRRANRAHRLMERGYSATDASFLSSVKHKKPWD